MESTPPQQQNTSYSQLTYPSKVQPSRKSLLLLISSGMAMLILGLGAGYFLGVNKAPNSQKSTIPVPIPTNSPEEATMCTLDAQICADGTTSVGRIPPNCEFAKCPEDMDISEMSTTSSTELVIAPYLIQVDEEGDPLPGTRANIIIDLPEGSTINSKKMVTIDGEAYEIYANNVGGGLCGMTLDETGCGYVDEDSPIADILRVWKNNTGVIGLNLIAVRVGDYYLDNVVVTKYTKENYSPFTSQEVTLWKKLFQNMRVEKIETVN